MSNYRRAENLQRVSGGIFLPRDEMKEPWSVLTSSYIQAIGWSWNGSFLGFYVSELHLSISFYSHWSFMKVKAAASDYSSSLRDNIQTFWHIKDYHSFPDEFSAFLLPFLCIHQLWPPRITYSYGY